MITKAKLTLISTRTQEHGMRTEMMTGTCYGLPAIGERFIMHGESLTGYGSRVLRTSIVVTKEDHQDVVTFSTENSRYELRFIND